MTFWLVVCNASWPPSGRRPHSPRRRSKWTRGWYESLSGYSTMRSQKELKTCVVQAVTPSVTPSLLGQFRA